MMHLIKQVPFAGLDPESLHIEHMARGQVLFRFKVAGDASLVRPGGTISGPALFALADLVAWSIVCSLKGPLPLAVTTHMSIDFLRKPDAKRDIMVKGETLKDGSRLVVASVRLWAEGDEARPVAGAAVTYSVPPPATPAKL